MKKASVATLTSVSRIYSTQLMIWQIQFKMKKKSPKNPKANPFAFFGVNFFCLKLTVELFCPFLVDVENAC